MKLGHLLKKCAKIKKSEALVAGNEQKSKEADDVLSLLESEWTDEVSSKALSTLKENKMHSKEQVLPLTEDIMKLQTYLQKMTSTLQDSLSVTSQTT